jgi:hypothetical protein
MTPDAFVTKWAANTRSEQAASKEHFVNLCDLLEVPTPNSDATGASYAFEKGAKKAAGTDGWADVWRRGCFGWEYKSRGGDLEKAHDQLLRYCGALENPPLLITSDMDRIIVRTNFQGKVSERFEFANEDVRDPTVRNRLKACWTDPNRWMPAVTRQALTEKVAGEFAELAKRLRERKHDPQDVAHFVNRLVFCMFADHVELLPKGLLTKLLALSTKKPSEFQKAASDLFAAMADKGGAVGYDPVQWFNGGLFDDNTALPLDATDIALLNTALTLDWSEIDPSIFGTLFERGLDPDKRAQLGAHYTDREKIGLLVEAVVIRPLLDEWEPVKEQIRAALEERTLLAKAPGETEEAMVLAEANAITAKSQKAKKALRAAAEKRRKRMAALIVEAQTAYHKFMDRLRSIRVLDPACGSGNFLYMSLLALKDLELRIDIEAEVMGLNPSLPSIGPECVHGIEINSYAAELARVSVWIGHIQWARKNGYPAPSDPVLRKLQTIECRDAVLDDTGKAAAWPPADIIIGNPPFLGAKLMRRRLGIDYTLNLRAAYDGRLGGFTDLVCYWFERAREEVESGRAFRAGLVSTSSIRGGTNRAVLDRIISDLTITDAWSEMPWTIDGARVEVSLICFAKPVADIERRLDGVIVPRINPDLTSGLDMTMAKPLLENNSGSLLGIQTSGPHDIPGDLARTWAAMPSNPNGKMNRDILKPYWNGDDVAGRPRDMWLIDLPIGMAESECQFYSAAYAYLSTARYDPESKTDLRSLVDARSTARDRHARERWWEPYWPRPEMRTAIASVERYIVTTETSEHRLFAWVRYPVLPDKNLIVIARDDDTTFGILHSRFHEQWALRLGTSLEDRPRYTSTTTFRTFPFPDGLTPSVPSAAYASNQKAINIAETARKLVVARDKWLNPPELIVSMPDTIPGCPARLLPKDEDAAAILKTRTLTNLYNGRGTAEAAWLDGLHKALDDAVAEAYGWPVTITDDEAMEKLLAMNLARPKIAKPPTTKAA